MANTALAKTVEEVEKDLSSNETTKEEEKKEESQETQTEEESPEVEVEKEKEEEEEESEEEEDLDEPSRDEAFRHYKALKDPKAAPAIIAALAQQVGVLLSSESKAEERQQIK